MLRTEIHKKLAANAVILLLLLLAWATIRPMRLYMQEHTCSTSLEPELISEEVTEELDAGEYFTAQYDHLQTLEFYVDSVASGTQAKFQLFRVGDNMSMELVAEEDVDLPDEVPGYAVVSTDVDLVEGDTYVYTVRGLDGSRFTVGYESAEQAAASGTAAGYQLAFYNDTSISGVALKTRLTYRTALGTLPSIGLAAVYLVLAAAAMKVTGWVFRKKPEWNSKITILRAMQCVFTPVIVGVGAAGFLAVWPMKLFDSRLLDILVYETGIVLGVLFALYALWHDRTGMPEVMNAHQFRVNVWHYGIILCIAAILHFSADYMNATNELAHNVAMHWIVFFLSIILILMGDTPSNCSRPFFLVLITVPFGCLVYYCVCRVPSSEADYELRNAVLASRAAAIAAVSLATVSVIVMVVKELQKQDSYYLTLFRKKSRRRGLDPSVTGQIRTGRVMAEDAKECPDEEAPDAGSPVSFRPGEGGGSAASGYRFADERESGICEEVQPIPPAGFTPGVLLPVILLAVLLILFRNTRLWLLLLVFMWLLFYLRYRHWRGRGRFLQDLCEGILLDFGFQVVYSMLHRYYLAYHYSRFSMHFHTPTVTAYYLIVVAAAALTLFVRRWRETEGWTGRCRMARIWKEALALGMAGSYLMMSLTRSGIGTFAILCVAAAFCAIPDRLPRSGAAAAGSRGDLAVASAGFPADSSTGEPASEYSGPEAESAASSADGSPESAEDRGKRSFGARFGAGCRTLCAMVLIVLITFPAAYTGQRLISTAYAHPDVFEDVETYDDWIVRNTTWNCTRFMNFEIFLRDFGDRIIGGEIGSKLYYGLGWNVPQGYRTSELYVESEKSLAYEEAGMLASSEGGRAAGLLLTEETDPVSALDEDAAESEDISNGRLALYLAYLQGLNLTGHDVMGAELPSGELAVHAHNVILQVAWDCGIPTGAVFAVVLLLLLAASYRFAKKGRTGMRQERDPYAMMPFLLTAGFCVIGMVEWVFHFSNPFTIVLLFSIAPLLFRETASAEAEPAVKQ